MPVRFGGGMGASPRPNIRGGVGGVRSSFGGAAARQVAGQFGGGVGPGSGFISQGRYAGTRVMRAYGRGSVERAASSRMGAAMGVGRGRLGPGAPTGGRWLHGAPVGTGSQLARQSANAISQGAGGFFKLSAGQAIGGALLLIAGGALWWANKQRRERQRTTSRVNPGYKGGYGMPVDGGVGASGDLTLALRGARHR